MEAVPVACRPETVKNGEERRLIWESGRLAGFLLYLVKAM
jgi:hypothetical protein